MERLRILQCGPTAYQGGISVAIADLCLGLARQGHDVGLVCNGGEVLTRLEGTGVKVYALRHVGGTKSIAGQVVSMAQVRRSFRPDIVHTHGRGASLVSTLSGRYPDVFTLHSNLFSRRAVPIDVGVFRKLMSPMGRKVIVLNETSRKYCMTELGLDDRRIFTVSNGVDVDRFLPADPAQREKFRSSFGVRSDQTLVLFVGRFHPEKQPDAVVKLAEALRSRGLDDVKFLMIGDGELKSSIRRMVSTLGLDDRIFFLDFQDPLSAYQAADLLVMPSREEAFGLVAIEAAAAGCPVLRTRTGGFHEMIEEGVTGFGCDVDVEDFVSNAVSILKDPLLRARVAKNARQSVVANLSLAAHVQSTLAVYKAASKSGA